MKNISNRVVVIALAVLMLIAGIIIGRYWFLAEDVALPAPSEYEVVTQEIELSGDVTRRNTEVSGLAWYGDQLIILPQFADKLYAINRDTILAYLDGDTTAIEPSVIEFVVDGELNVDGFQGYEAIAFDGDIAYLTIEANSNGDMASYMIAGIIADGTLTVDSNTLIPIGQPANVDNKGHESIIMIDGAPVPIYEWNQYSDNINSFVTVYGDQPQIKQFPVIPYRLTDATDVDENGHFWMINFHFPDDTDRVSDYPFELAVSTGTHGATEQVESLIELQINDDGSFGWIDKPPLLLVLEPDIRHWEGLARLQEHNGFLLMTDKFPDTRLVFIEFPDDHPANQ